MSIENKDVKSEELEAVIQVSRDELSFDELESAVAPGWGCATSSSCNCSSSSCIIVSDGPAA